MVAFYIFGEQIMLLGKGTIVGNGESSPLISHKGGDAQISVALLAGTGTITMWTRPLGDSNFYPVVDSVRTVSDQFIADLTDECDIKFIVTNTSGSTFAYAVSI